MIALDEQDVEIEQFHDLALVGDSRGQQGDFEARQIVGDVIGVEVGEALGFLEELAGIDAQRAHAQRGEIGDVETERAHATDRESQRPCG